jgi:hypothetical protein
VRKKTGLVPALQGGIMKEGRGLNCLKGGLGLSKRHVLQLSQGWLRSVKEAFATIVSRVAYIRSVKEACASIVSRVA